MNFCFIIWYCHGKERSISKEILHFTLFRSEWQKFTLFHSEWQKICTKLNYATNFCFIIWYCHAEERRISKRDSSLHFAAFCSEWQKFTLFHSEWQKICTKLNDATNFCCIIWYCHAEERSISKEILHFAALRSEWQKFTLFHSEW